MSKKRKKNREPVPAARKPARPVDKPREPVPVVQVTKFECGVDAILRRAREKAMRDLAGRTG